VQIVSKAHLAGGDADSDRHWVEILVQGARMLCRCAIAVTGLEGGEDAREAGVLIEKAKGRLDRGDKELAPSVDLAEGIWSWALALKGNWFKAKQYHIHRFIFLQSKNLLPPQTVSLIRTHFSSSPSIHFLPPLGITISRFLSPV
jgi:hypothetical protein